MNQRKKILYIQMPPGGGSLIALYDMVKALDKTRFEPYIFCYEENEYTKVLHKLEAITIFYAKKKDRGKNIRASIRKVITTRLIRKMKRLLRDDVKMARHITAILEENSIDIIHHNNDFPFARQGIIANRRPKLPQVCHYRSLKKYQPFTFDWFIDRHFAKKISRHIYISNAVKNNFEKSLNIIPSKGVMLRDIIDVEKFNPDNSVQTADDLNIEKDKKIVSCIGRILSWKGQHIFIDAFAQVIKEFPNAKGLIVGSYESGVGNPAYFEQLKQQVVKLGLTEKIIFTGNRNDIPSILNISNCIVHSSIEPEPQGLIIVESLFYKKPIVVTDAGGAAELIVNGQGGIKVPAGNVAAMAEAICKLLSDPTIAYKEDQEPAILKEFNPEKQIAVIEKIYDEIFSRKAG